MTIVRCFFLFEGSKAYFLGPTKSFIKNMRGPRPPGPHGVVALEKIEVKSYKVKSWEAFTSRNFVLHFFLNFCTDLFYFWYGTPNRYKDYLCEISS